MIVMKMFSMVKTMIDEEYFNNNCEESPVMVLLEAVEVNNDCDGVINGNTGPKLWRSLLLVPGVTQAGLLMSRPL